MSPPDPDAPLSDDVRDPQVGEGDVRLERPIAKRAKWAEDKSTPRVRPLTTTDLTSDPPSEERYRVPLRRSLRELFRARELLFTFVERDLKVRYKQAALGAFWAIIQPLVLMVIFTVVFGRIARVPTGGVPYPIFSYAVLVPWSLFSGSINYGTNAIIGNSGIIRKIYCPREVFPLSSVASSGVDFLVSSVILLGMLIAFGYYPRSTWVAYPLLLVIMLLLTTTITLIVSAITVYFRDTRYAIPMLLQILLYATPVAYSLKDALKALPPSLRGAYPYANPLVPVMDGFRRVLVMGEWPLWAPLASAAGVGLLGVLVTYRWYKRIDGTFADVV